MAGEIFADPLQGTYFVILIILAPFSIAAILLRFVATRRSRRAPGLDDLAVLLACIVYWAYTVTSAYTLRLFDGRDPVKLAYSDPEEFARLQKHIYGILFLFPLQMFLCKVGVLALYYRVFGVNRTYAIWIYGLSFANAAWAIVSITLLLIPCRPVSKFWYPTTPGTCISQTDAAAAEEAFNSAIDFALVIMAIVMLQSLKMPKKMKWKLYSLFGLGSIVAIIGFIKIGLQYNPDGMYVFTVLGLWATVQMAAAIVCCCAPMYGSLVPQEGIWSRIVSTFSSRLRTSTRGASSQSRTQRTGSYITSSGTRQGWVTLEEGGTDTLEAWPGAHQAEVHALKEVSSGRNMTQMLLPSQGAIQVERSVDVVRPGSGI